MKRACASSSSENGNVIFFILIAIALFAALSMAISHTSQNGGGGISEETARVSASELMEYTQNLATTVSKLRLSGCSETEISFENTRISGYVNASAPADESCHVFSLEGGGMTYQSAYDMIITGGYIIANVGTISTDLIVDVRTSKSICEEINDLLDILNNGVDGPPTDKLSAGVKFTGDYTIASTSAANQRTEHAQFSGRTAGCRTNSGSGDSAIFYYYKVLLGR